MGPYLLYLLSLLMLGNVLVSGAHTHRHNRHRCHHHRPVLPTDVPSEAASLPAAAPARQNTESLQQILKPPSQDLTPLLRDLEQRLEHMERLLEVFVKAEPGASSSGLDQPEDDQSSLLLSDL